MVGFVGKMETTRDFKQDSDLIRNELLQNRTGSPGLLQASARGSKVGQDTTCHLPAGGGNRPELGAGGRVGRKGSRAL